MRARKESRQWWEQPAFLELGGVSVSLGPEWTQQKVMRLELS